MINIRTFLTTAMLIATIFFLFMFSGAAKGLWSDYNKNAYASEYESKESMTQASSKGESRYADDPARACIIYIGRSEDVLGPLSQWSAYQKRELLHYTAMEEVELTEGNPSFLVIDSDMVGADTVDLLAGWAKRGIPVIVNASKGAVRDLEDERVAEFLGIRAMAREETHLKGIHLYEGFLLGGETIYEAKGAEDVQLQDLDLSAPWYLLRAGTKTYLSGILEEEEEEEVPLGVEYMADGQMATKERPALVWRNTIYSGAVFVVNGTYLEGNEGLGFLAAMEYEMKPYLLYPVINAQNFVVVNYPSFSGENDALMQELYSRDSHSVLRDLVWPGLASMMAESGSRITTMVRAGLDREVANQPDGDALVYFMKLLRENKSEAGVSLWVGGKADDEGERQKTEGFLKQYLPDYVFATAYIGGDSFDRYPSGQYGLLLKDYVENQAILSLDPKGGLLLLGTNTGLSHTYREDLRMKSLETALGYATVIQDLEEVLYPVGDQSQWQNLDRNLSSNLITYWRPFEAFEELTLSQTAGRILDFMEEEASDQREGDEITIHSQTGSGYYILRLHGEEIASASGASYKKIETGAYLVTIQDKEARIQVEKEDALVIQ